ncbi:MAG TPA: lytic transglycosylase domain-containing protein [Armatimonadetes bacterium]|nr:lytic transglycosylase domain-containing protein [Armatimonadota bacterium]
MIPFISLAHSLIFKVVLEEVEARNPRLSPCVRVQIARALLDAAERHSVPPLLLCALVSKESGFNPNAFSPSGAIGLGQLKPGTARLLGVDDPWDIRKNLLATAEYLRWMLDEFEGRKEWVSLALAAYHLGLRGARREGALERPEVRKYVRAVLSNWGRLRRKAGLSPPQGK